MSVDSLVGLNGQAGGFVLEKCEVWVPPPPAKNGQSLVAIGFRFGLMLVGRCDFGAGFWRAVLSSAAAYVA
jgi:hypothetical protein